MPIDTYFGESPSVFGAKLAGDPGFEPGFPDSESGVLPLDESPVA